MSLRWKRDKVCMMKVFDTEIKGVKILEPVVHRDARGYFAETYNAGRYAEAGIDAVFVQDNESCSQKIGRAHV